MKRIVIGLIIVVGGLLLMAPADVDTFMMFRETSVPQLSKQQLRRELRRAEVMRLKVERYRDVVRGELARR